MFTSFPFYHTKNAQMKNEFDLGIDLRDELTGFEGVAIARVDYLSGASQYHLMSRELKDNGKPLDEWFDSNRLSEDIV